MTTQNPRAFISHVSEDQGFVEKFASDLRRNGVDAWYSEWEIKAGDSIRRKIDEGLTDCEIFLIVVSKASINEPWVQTELDAATVRMIGGKVRKIIPIKIDASGQLPPTLESLLGADFSAKPYDVALKGVLSSIFAVVTKPPLGRIPDLPPILVPRTAKISAPTAIFWMAMALAVVLIVSRLTVNIGMPPWVGQLATGVVLAGIVWKFFERVEAVLNDETKLEIAVWLVGVAVCQKIESWPNTFVKVFDRVFGSNPFSWRSFYRSAIVSLTVGIIGVTIYLHSSADSADTVADRFAELAFNICPRPLAAPLIWFLDHNQSTVLSVAVIACLTVGSIMLTNSLPDYVSLLETWLILRIMRRSSKNVAITALLIGDVAFTAGTAVVWNVLLFRLLADNPVVQDFEDLRNLFSIKGGGVWLIYPAFFTSIWLWLYAGSGFLLKAARRLDIGFDWFNRKFDIEKKPLQSIGLVAGVLVAMVYWVAVIVGRFVG